MTDAERKLWLYLRRFSPAGTHFRRQATIGRYFADFACHQTRLIIEVDGGGHTLDSTIAYDAKRTTYLIEHGYHVVRFWNNDVLNNIEGVMLAIQEALVNQGKLDAPHP